MTARAFGRRAGYARVLALGLGVGCTSLPPARPPEPRPAPLLAPPPELVAEPLDPGSVRVEAEAPLVDDHWILSLYDRIQDPGHTSWRVDFPGADDTPRVAHLLLPRNASSDGAPTAPDPPPVVIVFPITGGGHLVSEALALALVNRGYAALRLERRRLFRRDDAPDDVGAPARRLRLALLDARRLVDWLETRRDVDAGRIAAAGVSLGGILAATFVGLEPRVNTGFFVMAGSGLPELLYDSTEVPIRRFRDRAMAASGSTDRQSFVELARPRTRAVDPGTYAGAIDPHRVLLASAHFDRVVPPERTEALWQALGRPTWLRFPTGHYQMLPFFWWAVGKGADHLDRVFAEELGSSQPGEGRSP